MAITELAQQCMENETDRFRPSKMKIESGIPIPEVQPGRRPNERYPWRQLEVGQSFLVPCPSAETKRLWNSITKCRISVQKTLNGRQFVLRSVKGGIRAWRTA